MSLTFNSPHESRVNTLPFTAQKDKDYPYFSYIHTIKVKSKIYFKPNASQVIHFPIQPTLPLTFQTSDNEILFPSTPNPFFNTRFDSTFLTFYNNIKTFKLNLIVVLSLFKILLIIPPSSIQDTLDISKFPQLILNPFTIKLMM